MTPLVFAFIFYFLLLLLVGIVSHHKQTSSSDFIMGNRSLNYWLVALSAHASDMSAWLFMAFPMTVFVFGLSRAWIGIGLLVGMFLNWQFVAPKLRRMTEKYQCYTLSSFFEKRYQDNSGTIRFISAVMLLVFLTHYLSAGIIAMGLLFESIFGINYYIGISFAMLVAVIYTFMGGYVTVAWTDLMQGVFLLVVILIVPVMAFLSLPDGFQTIFEVAKEQNISLSLFSIHSPQSFFTIFSLALGWGLGYFGMPHVLTKFMGLKDPNEMYKAKWVGMTWQLITLSAAAFVGVVAIGYFPDGIENEQLVFVKMVQDLFHPFLAGLVLCGILAATMSTMDSQILVCASVISEDFYKKWIQPGASSLTLLKVSRIGVVAVVLVALFLASDKSATILETVSYSWSGLGSSFGPLILMSLYYNKSTKRGAIAGILVGGIVVLIWPSINSYIFRYDLLPMIPGFFMSLLTIYFLSDKVQNEELISLQTEP